MEVRKNDAMEAARRSLQAAFEHLECGHFKTAGTLMRAAGRYVEGIGEESVAMTGNLATLPLAFARQARDTGGRARERV